MDETPSAAVATTPRPAPAAKPVARKARSTPAKKAVAAAAAKSVTPAAKKAPAKAAAKPAAKAVVKPAAKPAAKSAVKPAVKKPAAKAAEPKAPKIKLVRDSFTMPSDEYAALAQLKQRALGAAHPVKKSELLRAGVKLLSGLGDAALLRALKNVPAIKTGRPKTKKGD